MAAALQSCVNEGTLSMADIEELQLTELVQKMKANQPSNIRCEPEEGEEQEEAQTWKLYSPATTPLRVSDFCVYCCTLLCMLSCLLSQVYEGLARTAVLGLWEPAVVASCCTMNLFVASENGQR